MNTARPRRTTTVADVMTAPAPTIEPDAPLAEVLDRLSSPGQEHLVLAVGTRPLGVITASSILAVLGPAGTNRGPQRARDLVRGDAPRLLAELRLDRAARAMATHDVDALAVVDFRGDLVGVLARRHLVADLANHGRSA